MPLDFKPHDYQRTAIQFALKNKYYGHLLDPGLGKTATTLSVIKARKSMNQIKGVLVIAPLRVCHSVWGKETQKWNNFKHMSVGVLHGAKKKQVLSEKHDIYVINPEGVKWLLTDGLHGKKNWPFDMLIVDESTKFKNPRAKRLRYLKQKLHKFKYRGVLTGTPAPRSLIDIFAQIQILDEGKTFGKILGAFETKYFDQCGFRGKELQLKKNADKAIYKKAAPYLLRMSAEEYLDMPELVFNKVYVDLPKSARKVYEDLEKELFAEIFDGKDEHEVTAASASVLYGKCHQVANGAVYKDQDPLEEKKSAKERGFIDLHNAKIEALEDIIDELYGKPVLVAYNFNHDLEKLKNAFGGRKRTIPYIGSGVSGKEGDKLVDAWNAGKLPQLFAHPASAGHGLNLQQQGNDVIFYSLCDDFENFEQFYRRIYRQGVKGKQVRVHLLMARDTVDEVIYNRIIKKDKTQQGFLNAMKAYRIKKLGS